MLLYLDNCCFNRPYDDQTQANIFLETQAKLLIQESILTGQHQLIWSYILQFENEQNPYIAHQLEIKKWRSQASQLVCASEWIITIAKSISTMAYIAKMLLHCACAVAANADYFITTDKQLIKKAQAIAELKTVNPLTFIQEEHVYENR